LDRLQVPLSAIKQQLPSDLPSQVFSIAHRIGTLLKLGLSNRARAISLSLVGDPKSADTMLSIGLYLDPTQIQRLVEYGPPADNKPEAKHFRELWGSKAETRKFRDGRILESVVWNAEGPTQRTQIFANLIQHLLSHHLGLPSTNVHFFASAYDAILAEASQVRNALYSADPQETGFSPITAAFDYMVKELQGLKDLPLQITSVIPVSEGLRYTTPFVPGAVRLKGLPSISTSANYLPLHDCHIVFEGSGKWPEDLAAIQKIKSAFLARLALSLPRAIPGCRTEMQFDITADPTNDSSSLVVILPQGFVFRLRIHHDRERTLMEDVLLNEEQDEIVRKSTQASLVRHHKRFTALPNHHNAISALQSRHSSYSTTVRITKRWLAAHCLAIHLPAELVELVCARVYLNAEDQYEVPATGTLGFARVLHLLSNWRWREEPLLVPIFSAPNVHEADMVATFPSQLKIKALQKFNALRKADPSISRSAWYVATEKDLGGRSWGELAPSKLVAGRVQLLAQLCLQAISMNMYTGNARVQVRQRRIADMERSALTPFRSISSCLIWIRMISCCT
jgi:U3 small nucleolar RNA-associated protein 22